ncbi:hypothetical protein GDO81_014877, partial [Engystomops pustulosus]
MFLVAALKDSEPQGTFEKIIKVNQATSTNFDEGDIIVQKGRSAAACTECLWPKSARGTIDVPYVLSSKYTDAHLRLFQAAMDEYESLTCVRFVPRTKEYDYINIESSTGCASRIGRIGGDQTVVLDVNGCMHRGVIQHELSHVLGFVHEHTRSDRDDYVTINFQNIAPGNVRNFNKGVTNNLGLEYDYGSVMHYNKYAFTTTLGKPTIEPKPNPNIPIGQRDGMSILDVSKINRLYQCDVCSNLLNNKNGSLTSANYPSAYPHGANCVWLIRTPSDQSNFKMTALPGTISSFIGVLRG